MAESDVTLSAVSVVKSPPPAAAGGEYTCDEVRFALLSLQAPRRGALARELAPAR